MPGFFSKMGSGSKAILFAFCVLAVALVLSILPLRKGALTGGDMNLLVITIDTIRKNRLGMYGPQYAFTPALNKVASEGVIFDQAMSPVPLTFPSHSSIFTGKYPPSIEVHTNNDYVLGKRHTTLAEILKKRGYFTAAVIAATPLTSEKGLNQGFDIYNDMGMLSISLGGPRGKDDKPLGDIRGGNISKEGLLLLKQAERRYKEDGQKFFLWLHYYDPHWPYDPPDMYQILYEDDLYAGEAAYTDACVDLVLDALKEAGLYENTVVVVVGDHGESLDEHDEATHGLFAYDTTMQVPFFIKAQNKITPGTRVSRLVRTVDVMPTVLDLLGIKGFSAETIDGESLLPLISGKVDAGPKGDGEVREAYGEALHLKKSYAWAEIFFLRNEDFKFLEMPREELYDLRNDPGETKNLIHELPLMADKMRNRLKEVKRRLKADNIDYKTTAKTPDELKQRLAALGYVGADMGKTEGKIISKKEIAAVIRVVNEGHFNKISGNTDKAIELYEKAIKMDPDMNGPYYELGDLFFARREYATAERYFRDYVKKVDGSSRGWSSLGGVLVQLGKYDEAEPVIEKALLNNPDNYVALANLGFVYFTDRLLDEAETHFHRSLKINDEFAHAHMGLAGVYATTGRIDAAIDELNKTIALDPYYFKAYGQLGHLMIMKKDNRAALAAFRRYIETAPKREVDKSIVDIVNDMEKVPL